MLKLKDIQTKPVIYQGLEVAVPADTNFMWLRHTLVKTILLASPCKPVWNDDRKFYIPPADTTTTVAVLEYAALTVEQVKDSLETDESLPTTQELQQLGVVVNLVKNLRKFATNLEHNVNKAKASLTAKNIQELMHHVYADEGELDSFYNHAIEEATKYGIVAEQDEDSDEDHEALLKVVSVIFK